MNKRLSNLFHLLPVLLLLTTPVKSMHSPQPLSRVAYDCSSKDCLERSNYKIRAILHGSRKDSFWRQVASAMEQVGRDMRVQFHIQFNGDDFEGMAQQILDTIDDTTTTDVVNALIVSIPTERVKEAIQTVVDSGLPVFGVNSGYECNITGLLGHVAMDEHKGGIRSAESFLSHWTDVDADIDAEVGVTSSNNETIANARQPTARKVLFVNHEKGNAALDLRMQGLVDTLVMQQQLQNSTIFVIEELVVDLEDSTAQSMLNLALETCQYDGILLAGGALLFAATTAYSKNGCNYQKQLLGVFDTNFEIYNSIALSRTTFSISQQQYLQGSLAVTMATLFATTGKSLLSRSSEAPEFGNYQSGPKIITLSNLPTDKQQVCEAEAFPTCRPGYRSRDRCECVHREDIRIGAAILASEGSSSFWALIHTSAQQAAIDMGVTLLLDPIQEVGDFDTDNARMAEKVKSLCQEGVDGVFTTIKSDVVADAIQFCQALRVPVISFRSGEDFSKQLGLTQHISMNDYAAGYKAGQAFVDEANIRYGYCVNWDLENDLTPRCQGFAHALRDSGSAEYVGTIAPVSHDNIALFQQVLEANITQGGRSWDGVGILLVSEPFLPAALVTKENHRSVVLGTMDENDIVHQALDDYLLLISIDQQPYLQGYLPVTLLSWIAHTKQALLTHYLETGPLLVQGSPSEAESLCEATMFQVCPAPFNKNQLDSVRPIGLTIMSIVILTALGCIGWVYWYRRERIVRVSQPIFLVAICIGAIIMESAIIPYSLDDGVLEKSGGCVGCECPSCDIACISAPWLMSVGFTIIFASLFSKIWRVNRLMTSGPSVRALRLSSRDVMIPFAVLLGLNLAFLVVWTIVDPMYWSRSRRCGSDDFTSYGYCILGSGSTSTAMAVSVWVVNLAAILMANYQAYKARNYSTEFSESRYIALAMLCILQVTVVALPLTFLVNDNPPAYFFVTMGFVTVICLSVLLLIFVPKILLLRSKTATVRVDGEDEPASTTMQGQNSSRQRRQWRIRSSTSTSGLRIRRRYSFPTMEEIDEHPQSSASGSSEPATNNHRVVVEDLPDSVPKQEKKSTGSSLKNPFVVMTDEQSSTEGTNTLGLNARYLANKNKECLSK